MDRLLFVCFFLSGLAGLVYQVVWLRWLILLFGATTLAISTILTAFMGGLALGSWVAIHEEMAAVLERQGMTDEAIRTWEALLERFPNTRTAHLRLAELWEKAGKRAMAREQLARYLDGEPDPKRAQAVRRQFSSLQ